MSDSYRSPERLHFYAPQLRVSLELPVDWDESARSDESVTYREDEDAVASAERRAAVVVTTRAVPVGAPEDSYRQLANAMLREQAAHEEADRIELRVDGFEAVADTFTVDDTVSHQVVTQIENVLIAFVGTCSAARASVVVPTFRDIVASVRFIMPEAIKVAVS